VLLAVNVGNSSVSYGLFERRSLLWHRRQALAENPALPKEAGASPVTVIALASVAPTRTGPLLEALTRAFGVPVLIAGKDLPFEMEIECEEPSKVGADRLLNAMAAHARTGVETIAIDVGTAVTVDVVSARGSFCGGAIAPGPETMLRALTGRTELLPAVSLERPAAAIGRNTAAAMRSGAWFGTIGLVKEMIARMRSERGGNPPVLVTGGAGGFVADALGPRAQYLPHLTLEGLAILAEGYEP